MAESSRRRARQVADIPAPAFPATGTAMIAARLAAARERLRAPPTHLKHLRVGECQTAAMPAPPPTATAPGDAARTEALAACRDVFPSWRELTVADIDFADPKGFSSFTMAMRVHPTTDGPAVDPPAVLYRRLAGKENAILDAAAEKAVFLLLGRHGIAAHCHHYGDDCRIEEFYDGRTLTAADVFDPAIQRGIADELWRFHHLEPESVAPDMLPEEGFFELLHDKWGAMARTILTERRHEFPPDEQHLCDDLAGIEGAGIHREATREKVRRCLPDGPTVFCHNDTYHGNVMQLRDGTIKLLDFEFSCRNHPAFDFANLFAETVMEHGIAEPPHFRIAAPRFDDADLAAFIGYYLDNADEPEQRAESERERLVAETRRCLMLSDLMYAMAALPLALEPIQKIRFLPYAHQRFHRFLRAWDREFPTR